MTLIHGWVRAGWVAPCGTKIRNVSQGGPDGMSNADERITCAECTRIRGPRQRELFAS